MIVCIAEKPSVARDIAEVLGAHTRKEGYIEGNGYQVTWTFGHLCTLKEPHEYTPNWKSWNLGSLPMIPPRFGIKLIENPTYEKQFHIIEGLMQNANPKYLERSMRKLVREQRRLSRREKGSHNRDKQRIRVAKVHEKVTNQRNDFLQKQSTMLVCENQTICIEDLHVKGMIRNHKLAKSIASVSWAKFFEMLEYKAVWYGNEIRKVPTMYPSSQTCSACGYRNPLVKNLRIRIWECPGCHAVHDRDTNAGINILKKGLQLQSA